MKFKIILLSFMTILILASGCTKDDNYNLVKQEYESLQQEYSKVVEELENFDEISTINNDNKIIIADLNNNISELEEDKESLLIENKKLQDEFNEEIWGLRNESFMNIKVASFWEQGVRSDFDGEPYFICESESMAGLMLGDSLGDVIEEFGNDFEVYFSDDGFEPVISYDGFSFSVSEYNYCITELYMSVNMYETSLGIKVGDNALTSINKYRALYKSNEDGSIHTEYPKWIFDLGDDFIIQFNLDTDELTDSSVITRIILRNFYHGDI